MNVWVRACVHIDGFMKMITQKSNQVKMMTSSSLENSNPKRNKSKPKCMVFGEQIMNFHRKICLCMRYVEHILLCELLNCDYWHGIWHDWTHTHTHINQLPSELLKISCGGMKFESTFNHAETRVTSIDRCYSCPVALPCKRYSTFATKSISSHGIVSLLSFNATVL